MNELENEYFILLNKDRTDSANTLEKPSMKGIKKSVVDKYSDQAHFIYELLQNADDVHATEVSFSLEKEQLVFLHNGTRYFSISNPKTEDADGENGTLGDLNAITSIANSSKTDDGAKIGKFGVGFKAVFQYTNTPIIYDPNVFFKIERFIVPILLDKDYPNRKKNETVFVFPFDDKVKEKKEAYEDIQIKLDSLIYPILFLKNLNSITYSTLSETGSYKKTVLESFTKNNILCENIEFIKSLNNNNEKHCLWLFSQQLDKNKISVGFFTNNKGKIIEEKQTAFCFFPTKVNTNLNFIINAPFLLTDSREGIKAGNNHNKQMIQSLAELAASALEILKEISITKRIELFDDETFINLIPYNENLYISENERTQISLLPFYTEIKNKITSSELIPCGKLAFTNYNNACWATYPNIPELFSNEQLGTLVDNQNVKWILPTIGRNETLRTNSKLCSYIDGLASKKFDDEEIIKLITSEFIEHQDIQWLFKFYDFINSSNQRKQYAKHKPIFLNKQRKASEAFDINNHLILFITDTDNSNYNSILQDLLQDEKTRELINSYGIKKPELKDEVYNKIIPDYNELKDEKNAFKKIFSYYKKCPQDEITEYETYLKKLLFRGTKDKDYPSDLYLRTKLLTEFFIEQPNYLDLDYYKSLINSNEYELLNKLFSRLDVNDLPKKQSKYIGKFSYNEIIERGLFNTEEGGYREKEYTEYYFEGINSNLHYIIDNEDTDKSLTLWKVLNLLCKKYYSRQYHLCSGYEFIIGRCKYFFRYNRSVTYNTELNKLLLNGKWLVNKAGCFVTAKSINKNDLAEFYFSEDDDYSLLLNFLDIHEAVQEEPYETANLTEEQKRKIEFANKLKEYGIENEEDLEAFREFKRQRDAQRYSAENADNVSSHNAQSETSTDDKDIDDIFDEDSKDNDEQTEKEPLNKATTEVLKNIAKRTKHKSEHSVKRIPEDEEPDEDELLPSSVDYSKKIERALEKSAAEVKRISYLEGLQKTALEETQNNKYSYKWFNTLLEMESINSGESNANSKEVSISFSTVERESGTKRTLVLKHPNRYIPQFMEDLADIPLVLHMGEQTKTVAIEVASIKSYTLRVKMKNASDIDGIDLDTVTSATIDAKSPTFLIEELRKQFAELKLSDEYNMQKNLCKNIEFVFGPPGTGKTTHLAQKVLIPMMRENKKCKVLVLTPTNKSADVLVKRIMEVSGRDHTYKNWLVRFGATGDEEIEQSPVYRDKTFDIRTLEKNVTVTTIARFPYDFFMPEGSRLFLYGIDWDYIVIDEASMIPIANIVLPLYKKTPRKFIIAGDPFQIEPITSVDLWKNENIYTMVHLDSFVEPKTIPHTYNVEFLTTQYRSIPDVGFIFSNFAYGGILKHHRTSDSQRQLNLGDDFGIQTLNVIKFPVSKYESIYRCKRLQHSSSYQVYSALFTFEYVCYLSRAISEKNSGQLFKIGVIAPYRAQADMIDKLLASEKLPKEVDVQVGTIHGFQGDECDIIFAVFNTPPSISSSNEMFLNKRNIINVSISRARDYLFVVMPDDKTENIQNLRLVKRVEDLIHSTNSWTEFHSSDLEQSMFGDSQYLENNAFSTSHQSVNVYGLPEKCYEVRAEDTAIDVQIHKPSINKGTSKELENETLDEIRNDEYIDSYQLKEELIPEELRKTAIDLPVKGAIKGWCYLVPYEGKVKDHTLKQTEVMFIPLMRNGQEKMVTVSVVKEDRIIYIAKGMFKLYEQGLSAIEGIELKKIF